MTSLARRSPLLLALSGLLLSCSGDGPTKPPTPAAAVSIADAPAEGVLLVGGNADLSAVVTSATGATLSRAVTWSTSSAAIATVTGDGLVTGVAAGPALIIATIDDVADTLLLSVRVAVPMTPAGAPAAVTTTVLGGAVALTVPPGAAAATALTVAPAALVPDDDRLLAGAAFDFGPSGTTFASPVTMSLHFNAAAVPVAKRPRLRIHRVENDGSLTLLPDGVVDLVGTRVSAPVTSFSTYALVVPADVASLTVIDGNSQAAHVGTAVQGLSVRALDAQQRPVALAEIAFSVQTGNGSIQGASTTTTNAEGVATLPGSWVLGPAKGTQTVRATLVGDGRFVTFTATATAPATTLLIESAPTEGSSGVTLDPPLIVRVLDAFGDPVTEIGRQVSVSVASGAGSLAGTLTENAPTGLAIFQNLRLAGSGAHRLVVTSDALTPDTTDVIAVTQELAALVLTTQPAGAVSGLPFTTQPVVELRDHAGLRLIGGDAMVTASAVHGPGVPFGTLTAVAEDGIATFSGLAIEGPGAQQLRFSAGFADVISNEFTVAPAPAGVYMRVGAEPSRTVNPGQLFGPDFFVDLSNAGGANLAALQVTITWDTARFEYVDRTPMSWTDANGATSTVTVDESNASDGVLVVSASTPGPTTASFILVRVLLQARQSGAGSTSTLTATVNSATNAASGAVAVNVRPLSVTILSP